MDTVLNRHLWLLTGRQNDFVTPELNTGRLYPEIDPSDEILSARRVLWLNDRTTDYYVIGAMAALVVFRPEIGGDVSTLFAPQGLHVKAPSITNGTLQPAGTQHPTLLHRPKAIPAPRQWYIRRLSSDLVRISTDTGYSKDVQSREVGNEAGFVVYVDWPAEVGFHAAFTPLVWEIGSQVVISTEPSGYPYDFVASEIRKSIELVRLMSAAGTLAEFHAAQGAIQKVGALAAAVVQWCATAQP